MNFGRGEDLEESPEHIQEWEPEPDDDDLDLDYDTDDYIWDKAHLYPDALTKAEKANIGLPAVIHFTRHHEEGHCPKDCLYNNCLHFKNLDQNQCLFFKPIM